ncbi:MAG: MFS transporter, partial [Pseudomonadota bacterium]|nr:MFS transporter [Pseudomonadota bacterium]
DYHHAVLTEHIRTSAAGWANYQMRLSAQGITGTKAMGYVDHVISQQAMTLGVNDVFHALAWIFLLLIPFIWLAKPPFAARGTDAAL